MGLKTPRQMRLYLHSKSASFQPLYLLRSSFRPEVIRKLIYKLSGLQSFSFLPCTLSTMHTYIAFYEFPNTAQ